MRESFDEVRRLEVARASRAIIGFRAIRIVDSPLLLRAVEVYEVHALDFADASLVASAERTGVGVVVSFDRGIDRAGTVRREEPRQGPQQGRPALQPCQRLLRCSHGRRANK